MQREKEKQLQRIKSQMYEKKQQQQRRRRWSNKQTNKQTQNCYVCIPFLSPTKVFGMYLSILPLLFVGRFVVLLFLLFIVFVIILHACVVLHFVEHVYFNAHDLRFFETFALFFYARCVRCTLIGPVISPRNSSLLLSFSHPHIEKPIFRYDSILTRLKINGSLEL